MTKNDFLHKIIEMLKTINIGNRIEKRQRTGRVTEIWTHREKVSPAESTFERRNCEVPGSRSCEWSSRVRQAHVTCVKVKEV